jgi:hypothetical protein
MILVTLRYDAERDIRCLRVSNLVLAEILCLDLLTRSKVEGFRNEMAFCRRPVESHVENKVATFLANTVHGHAANLPAI